MGAAWICDIGAAVDIFLIRTSVHVCLGPQKDGFYAAQKHLVNLHIKPLLNGICIERNSVNYMLFAPCIMLHSIY
jgi:hypothetical protein